jgi:flagellar biosynthetic protein FliQ
MTPTEVYDVAQLSIVTLLWVSGPLMLIALAVGLLIALFQALTSIQEITLTFVPKILVVFAALIFLLPLMADRMSIMAEELFGRIVGG